MMVSCEDHALIVPSKKIISRSKKLADFDHRDLPGNLQRSENLALNPKSWIGVRPISLWYSIERVADFLSRRLQSFNKNRRQTRHQEVAGIIHGPIDFAHLI